MGGKLLNWFDTAPRRVLAAVAAVGVAMLAFGLYLQLVVGLVPCPMCIVQRYALILVVLVAALAALFPARGAHLAGTGLMLLAAGFGAFVAARQSWLQWFPPEVSSCGRDFYGMIENFPLRRAIPMIFKGSGDCTKIDWTFLGGSLANWSFIAFTAVIVVALTLLVRQSRGGPRLQRRDTVTA
jgi:disulfide bond formation protein DsbB